MKKSEVVIPAVAVSTGIAIAKIQLVPSELEEIKISSIRLKNTIKYWYELLAKAKDQLSLQIKRYRFAKTECSILKAHLEILKDQGFQRDILAFLHQGDTIRLALEHVLEKWKQQFNKIKNALLQERLLDIQDVIVRLLNLCKRSHRKKIWPDSTCIYTKQALPSTLVEIPSDKLKAVVCPDVSKASHLALLARAKGIPCLSQISLPADSNKCLAVIDGDEGRLILNPSRATLAKYQKKIEPSVKTAVKSSKISSKVNYKLNGRFWANIDTFSDLTMLPKVGYYGIGLVRTEYFAYEKGGIPSVRTQRDFYTRLLRSQKGKPVTIRLYDFGSDKPHHAQLSKELNPALGCRGVRYLLKNPVILKDQLTALLQASHEGKLHILVPMVCHPEQMSQVRVMMNQIAREMNLEQLPQLGMMVEIPAAAITLNHFFGVSDFFSIGSNDLLQYVHAVDRSNSHVQDIYNPFSSALLHLIKVAVDWAKKEAKPVSLCGEMASDPAIRRLLQKMGLKDFSVSPQTLRHVLGLD